MLKSRNEEIKLLDEVDVCCGLKDEKSVRNVKCTYAIRNVCRYFLGSMRLVVANDQSV
jgi:hypothetical protein